MADPDGAGLRVPLTESWLTSGGWTWVTSIAVHAAVVVVGGWLALASMRTRAEPTPEAARAPDLVPVELPVMAEGNLLADSKTIVAGEPPTVSGGTVIPRLDTGTQGRGGDGHVSEPAIHMSDTDEGQRLSTDLLSRLDRDQTQRVRSSSSRASWEDRRSTTHPAELTFVSTGNGDRRERRALGASDPSRGALFARDPSVQGGELGTVDPIGELGQRSGVGGAQEGSLDASPGRGVRDGVAGDRHRTAAAVARMRPDVARAPVAVEAAVKSRVRDNIDSEQEVATVLRSLVHESTAGGLPGAGRGGVAGGAQVGAGGESGAGSHPMPLGDGLADWFDINTSDPRLLPYFRHVQAKIEPLWVNAFPKSALLELKQGTVILEFTIAEDGSVRVAWPPVRPSGIDEFDRNCADAIRKAAPFEAIPRELGRSKLRIRAPFDATNPLVSSVRP